MKLSLLKIRSGADLRSPLRSFPAKPTPRCNAGSIDSPNSDPERKEKDFQKRREEADEVLKAKLPKTGYLSMADPAAAVYSRSTLKVDPTKRGGRYKSDFVWNEEWQKSLQIEESLQRQYEEAKESRSSKQGRDMDTPEIGAVSFSRLSQLDDINVDITTSLLRKDQAVMQQDQGDNSSNGQQPGMPVSSGRRSNETRRPMRFNSGPKQGKTFVTSTRPDILDEKRRAAAAEEEKYEREKSEQRAWTAVFSVIGAAATYSTYGREASISYIVGALAGLFYLRLLGKSVDGFGAQVVGAGNILGQPRLLIPLILGLAYDRWNKLFAEDYGVYLNFLPLVVGFLTYKIAVLTLEAKHVAFDSSSQSDTN